MPMDELMRCSRKRFLRERFSGEKESAMRPTSIVSAGPAPGIAVLAFAVLVIAALVLPQAPALAGSADGKRPPDGRGRGPGFLPGYEPPEVVQWRRHFEHRPAYWYGGPRYYRGRWNGGGFGPCWTPTPIGPHWNCG
jgi:hypothetical protein